MVITIGHFPHHNAVFLFSCLVRITIVMPSVVNDYKTDFISVKIIKYILHSISISFWAVVHDHAHSHTINVPTKNRCLIFWFRYAYVTLAIECDRVSICISDGMQFQFKLSRTTVWCVRLMAHHFISTFSFRHNNYIKVTRLVNRYKHDDGQLNEFRVCACVCQMPRGSLIFCIIFCPSLHAFFWNKRIRHGCIIFAISPAFTMIKSFLLGICTNALVAT